MLLLIYITEIPVSVLESVATENKDSVNFLLIPNDIHRNKFISNTHHSRNNMRYISTNLNINKSRKFSVDPAADISPHFHTSRISNHTDFKAKAGIRRNISTAATSAKTHTYYQFTHNMSSEKVYSDNPEINHHGNSMYTSGNYMDLPSDEINMKDIFGYNSENGNNWNEINENMKNRRKDNISQNIRQMYLNYQNFMNVVSSCITI